MMRMNLILGANILARISKTKCDKCKTDSFFGLLLNSSRIKSFTTAKTTINGKPNDDIVMSYKHEPLLESFEQLMKSSKPIKNVCSTNPNSVSLFLTGSTGFLGNYILKDLCTMDSTNKIYCLVRASSLSEAKIRLNIQNHNKSSHKIIPIIGNLKERNLGIDTTTCQELAEEIDVICHNGALVHHLLPYESLRSANVQSTYDLLKLCLTSKSKSFHYISTLAAGLNPETNEIAEEFPNNIASMPSVPHGYSSSKHISEILCSKARDAISAPHVVRIYRPSWITGDSKTGWFQAPNKDHRSCLIKTCIQLGIAPEIDYNLNMIPVDVTSKIITTALELSPNNKSQVMNIINPCPLKWTQLIKYLNTFGYNISLVQASEWQKQLLKQIKLNSNAIALHPFISAYSKPGELGLFTSQKPTVQTQTTTNINCFPRPSEEMIFKYVQYWKNVNFLNY